MHSTLGSSKFKPFILANNTQSKMPTKQLDVNIHVRVWDANKQHLKYVRPIPQPHSSKYELIILNPGCREWGNKTITEHCPHIATYFM